MKEGLSIGDDYPRNKNDKIIMSIAPPTNLTKSTSSKSNIAIIRMPNTKNIKK